MFAWIKQVEENIGVIMLYLESDLLSVILGKACYSVRTYQEMEPFLAG